MILAYLVGGPMDGELLALRSSQRVLEFQGLLDGKCKYAIPLRSKTDRYVNTSHRAVLQKHNNRAVEVQIYQYEDDYKLKKPYVLTSNVMVHPVMIDD